MKVGCQVAAAGGILRDDQGKWVIGFAINLDNCFALVAEIWGAWQALQIAWVVGGKKVILELDNKVATQLIINGTSSINASTSLVVDIRRMLQLEWEVKVQHVLREGNRTADALANIGIRLPIGLYKFAVAPKNVHEIVIQDVIGISFNRLCN